jgi:putative lipase involved disintegration of autophagic bodies
MKKLLILLILLVFAVPAYTATIYKWVDKEGVVNFTDDPSKVPPSYQNRVEMEEKKDVREEVSPRPPQAVTSEKEPEEIKKDIYGRDETWWREKVGMWKQRLKEATENLEKLREKYAEQTEQLGHTGLVSRARYQDKANKYTEEKKKYEAQIAEANAMLEKLSKEAQESKADPAWLE